MLLTQETTTQAANLRVFDVSQNLPSRHTYSHRRGYPRAEGRTVEAKWMLKFHYPAACSSVDDFHVVRSRIAKECLNPGIECFDCERLKVTIK